jgi:hypothetical protein
MIRKIMRIVVVFPEPLGPMNPYIEPVGTERERLETAVCFPYVLVTSSICTIGTGNSFLKCGRGQQDLGGVRWKGYNLEKKVF